MVYIILSFFVRIASTSSPNENTQPYVTYLASLSVPVDHIVLNSSTFDEYIVNVGNTNPLYSSTNAPPSVNHLPSDTSSSTPSISASPAHPSLVIFDRFFIEEQFGWRVKQHCPSTIRILDTQDLFAVRSAREAQIKAKDKEHREGRVTTTLSLSQPSYVPQHGQLPLSKPPPKGDNSPYLPPACDKKTIRELSSILRCDVSLMVSQDECSFLLNKVGLPQHKVMYLPIAVGLEETGGTIGLPKARSGHATLETKMNEWIEKTAIVSKHRDGLVTNLRSVSDDGFWEEEGWSAQRVLTEVCREPLTLALWETFMIRRDFVFIGTMRHAPNVDCVERLAKLMPKIRQRYKEVRGKLGKKKGWQGWREAGQLLLAWEKECNHNTLDGVLLGHIHRCIALIDSVLSDDENISLFSSGYVPELHVYGTYINPRVAQLHDPAKGIVIKGMLEGPVTKGLGRYKALLVSLSWAIHFMIAFKVERHTTLIIYCSSLCLYGLPILSPF